MCSEVWQVIDYSQVVPFDPSQLDPQLLAVMFAGGFFVLVPVWAACQGVRLLLQFLRGV